MTVSFRDKLLTTTTGGVLSVIILLFGCPTLTVAASLSMVLKIDPYEEECFMFKTPDWKNLASRPRHLMGDYEVISDHGPITTAMVPVAVVVLNEQANQILYQSPMGSTRSDFDVPLQADTKYWICVHNQSPHLMQQPQQQQQEEFQNMLEDIPPPETVQIGLSYRVSDALSRHVDIHKTASNWQYTGSSLHAAVRRLQNHIDYIKVREMNHRAVTEKTFVDILLWTLAEAGMVICVAVGQVWYLRRFVEKKRYM